MIAHKTDRVVGFYNFLTDEIDNAKKRKDEIATFIKVREAAQIGSRITSALAWKSSRRRPSRANSMRSRSANPPKFCTLTTKTWCRQSSPRWRPPSKSTRPISKRPSKRARLKLKALSWWTGSDPFNLKPNPLTEGGRSPQGRGRAPSVLRTAHEHRGAMGGEARGSHERGNSTGTNRRFHT